MSLLPWHQAHTALTAAGGTQVDLILGQYTWINLTQELLTPHNFALQIETFHCFHPQMKLTLEPWNKRT